jgi:hypothetical protein
MIGNGGISLVGRKARKRQLIQRAAGGSLPPVLKPAAPRVIKAAIFEQGRWKYTLDMAGLGDTAVFGDDDNWELLEQTVDPEQAALAQYIRTKVRPDVSGSITDWLQHGETAAVAIASGVAMNQSKLAGPGGGIKQTDGAMYLWSGGAADCIIVAVYSQANEMCQLTHATQLNRDDALELARRLPDARIYLSSTKFANPDQAADSTVVKGIVGDCKKESDQKKVVAFYNSGKLAINGRTGAVLSTFSTSGLAKVVSF